MIERLTIVKQCFDEVSDLIIQPEILADQKRYVALNREYKELSALMEKTNCISQSNPKTTGKRKKSFLMIRIQK